MTNYSGSSVAQTYFFSPHDFTVEVLARDTLKLSGLPWEPTVEYFVNVVATRPSGPQTVFVVKSYWPGSHVFVYSARKATLQVQGADFRPDDTVKVLIVGPEKAYCVAGDYNRTVNVNPVGHDELVELKCTGCGGAIARPVAGGSVQCEYCGKPYWLKQVGG